MTSQTAAEQERADMECLARLSDGQGTASMCFRIDVMAMASWQPSCISYQNRLARLLFLFQCLLLLSRIHSGVPSASQFCRFYLSTVKIQDLILVPACGISNYCKQGRQGSSSSSRLETICRWVFRSVRLLRRRQTTKKKVSNKVTGIQ
jgi:hypothetical protein